MDVRLHKLKIKNKGHLLRRLREYIFRASTKILDAVDFESSLKNDIRSAEN